MRICIVNPFYDNAPSTFLEVTGRYRHVEALAAALARRGHDVAVVQAFFENKVEKRGDVQFRYAATPWRSVARLSGGRTGLDLLLRGNLKNLIAAIADFKPDAVHMNGITLLQPLAAIGSWCAKRGLPFTVSYHGGEPKHYPWLRGAERAILRHCRGAFFTTREHADPWVSAGLLQPSQIIECMEVSSTFTRGDRASARARTGMVGTPIFVWNAGLHTKKDPLTALRGFAVIRRSRPDARLYMIHVSDDMLSEVMRVVASDDLLCDSVELRGRISHDAVQDFLNSADFIVQSSVREVAGYSILEAMACGVIPVVTDIPSFRLMTDNGRYGFLFPVGDFEAMADRVLRIAPSAVESHAQSVASFFSSALSYDAIAVIYERACTSTTQCAIA